MEIKEGKGGGYPRPSHVSPLAPPENYGPADASLLAQFNTPEGRTPENWMNLL